MKARGEDAENVNAAHIRHLLSGRKSRQFRMGSCCGAVHGTLPYLPNLKVERVEMIELREIQA